MPKDWEDSRRYGRGHRHERVRGPFPEYRDRDWDERESDEMQWGFGDEDMEEWRRDEDRRAGMGGYRGDYSDEFGYGRGSSYGGYYGPASNERYHLDAPAGHGPYGKHRSPRRAPYGGSGGYRGEFRHRNEDRGFLERAGDEVASWFGSEEAQRRREMDDRFRGRGPKNYTRSDDRIREDVCDRLCDDPHIDASDIEVTVSGGEVTLEGTVRDRFAKRHAEDLSERASGVKHVQNNLRRNEQQSSSDLAGATASTRH
ncbi:BON domain-containing protein [Candidatus Filomicrobium marinum]|uniref:BON domain-containing protein n=1 Tax=Candidatus Filomicrobium marinum TaxID=1608628 RepID=UPI000A684AB3|nr:BON domain-containing protein [Candidatus Filomicrobium marinum]